MLRWSCPRRKREFTVETPTQPRIDLPAAQQLLKGPSFHWERACCSGSGVHTSSGPMIDGVNCVKIEPDIDYYRDAGVHLLLKSR